MVTNQKSGSRRERKKAATREHLLAVAIPLFGERGIDALTVDEIALAADIGKGTIYNYFATKEEMVVAFLVEVERKVQARVGRFASSSGNLDEIFTAFVRFQFRLKRPYYQFVRVFLAQMFAHTEQFLPYIAELQTVIDPPLSELLTSLQGRGLLRTDVPLPALIHQFKTFHLGLTCTWAIEGPPWKESERRLPEQIRLFCQGWVA